MKMILLLSCGLISFSTLAQEILLAKFETINTHVNGTLAGSSTFYKKGDLITVYNRLFAGAPSAWHMQNIYTGNRCPVAEDDTNMDGIIDIKEGNEVLGKILIPLDSDINSQMAGYRVFPVADMYGSYFYEKDGSFRALLSDLRKPDPDPFDNIVKLSGDEALQIEGKVVVIHGINETFVHLPETVQSEMDLPAWKTIPIACGILRRASRK